MALMFRNVRLTNSLRRVSKCCSVEASAFDLDGLISARPGRRCVAEEAQLSILRGFELETPTNRNHECVTGTDVSRLRRRRFRVGWAAPDPALAACEIPDLFDRSMVNRLGHRAGSETNFAKPGSCRFVLRIENETYL
jgi:hypothetical protein